MVVGEEIDERAGGRFYGIAVGIDSVRLDGSPWSGPRLRLLPRVERRLSACPGSNADYGRTSPFRRGREGPDDGPPSAAAGRRSPSCRGSA
jgi:hypothetical protein